MNIHEVYNILTITFAIITALSALIVKMKTTIGVRPERLPSVNKEIEKAVDAEYELQLQEE